MAGSGRPSKFTQAIADEICERLAMAEALSRICAEPGMPSQSMVYRWLATNESFRENFARARQDCADTLSHEVIEIADSVAGEKRSMVSVQAARLRIDARVKMMQLLKPKSYGDKQQHEVGGIDGKPIEAAITVQFVKSQNGSAGNS